MLVGLSDAPSNMKQMVSFSGCTPSMIDPMIIYEKEQQEGKERENLIQTCISRLRDELSFTGK